MNDHGQPIGHATRWLASDGYGGEEATVPFVLDHGLLTFLPDLSGGVRRINDAGLIVGSTGRVTGGGVVPGCPNPSTPDVLPLRNAAPSNASPGSGGST